MAYLAYFFTVLSCSLFASETPPHRIAPGELTDETSNYRDIFETYTPAQQQRMKAVVEKIKSEARAGIYGNAPTQGQIDNLKEKLVAASKKLANSKGASGISLIVSQTNPKSVLIADRYLIARNASKKMLVIFDLKEGQVLEQASENVGFMGIHDGKLLVIDNPKGQQTKMSLFYDGRIGAIRDTEWSRSPAKNTNFSVNKPLPNGSSFEFKYSGYGDYDFKINDKKVVPIVFQDLSHLFVNNRMIED